MEKASLADVPLLEQFIQEDITDWNTDILVLLERFTAGEFAGEVYMDSRESLTSIAIVMYDFPSCDALFTVLSTDNEKLLKLLKCMLDKTHFNKMEVAIGGRSRSTEYIYNSLVSSLESKIRKEDTTCTYVYKQKEILSAISLPVGYSSSQIKPKDVAFACSQWGFSCHKSTECIRLFEILSGKYDAVAVYHGTEVVAWMFESTSGAFLHLYTMPDHRHKRLGAFVVQEMTRKQLAKGNIPFAYVAVGGEKTFAQVGYEKVGNDSHSFLGFNREK